MPVRVAERLEVGRLQERVRLDRLVDVLLELLRLDLIERDVPARIDDAEPAVVELDLSLGRHQADEQRREVRERADLLAELLEELLGPGERLPGDRQDLRQLRHDGVAHGDAAAATARRPARPRPGGCACRPAAR